MTIKIVLRNPLRKTDTIDYEIDVDGSEISHDWKLALQNLIQTDKLLEKNFCFVGFPRTSRTLEYLCQELNRHVVTINMFSLSGVWEKNGLDPIKIEDYYSVESIRWSRQYPISNYNDSEIKSLNIKQSIMNRLHNYFELLQGTVWNLSPYYKLADYQTKYAIRQLNNLCHEIESLVLSQRKEVIAPDWIRPSQINTWIQATRYDLKDSHRNGFLENGYDRKFGHVYLHWCQIGKTLFEVFRDEGAPDLVIGDDPTDISVGAGATCEAITALKFYSGEFDVEWGQDVVYGSATRPWHNQQMDGFYTWLEKQNLDRNNKNLSLGYLHLGSIDTKKWFGESGFHGTHSILSNYLDVYAVEVDGVKKVYDYCWSDLDYEFKQIEFMKQGYDYSSRS